MARRGDADGITDEGDTTMGFKMLSERRHNCVYVFRRKQYACFDGAYVNVVEDGSYLIERT